MIRDGAVKSSSARASRRLLEACVAVPLAAMAVLTGVDVVGRYAFGMPVYGAAEAIGFLLAITVFAALPLVSLRDAHVSVDLLSGPLASRWPGAHRAVTGACTVLGLGVIAWRLAALGLEAMRVGRTTIVLEWPTAPVILTCAALSLAAAVVQAWALFRPASRASDGTGPG